MARTKRLLNGAAKDAFLKRVLAAEPGLDDETRERLTQILQSSIALIAQRHGVVPPQPFDVTEADVVPSPAVETTPHTVETVAAATPEPEPEPFDPYSPNVIVVFRTRGRDAALEELHSIEDVDCLRLLAREQQLGIAMDLADAADIRQAIVAAAERRIANRRAAAS